MGQRRIWKRLVPVELDTLSGYHHVIVKDSFVKAVQRKKVAQPTQLAFVLKTWSEVFAATAEPSIADARLHETGIWVFQKLESVRRKLDQTWLNLPSKRDHLLMFVASANRDCHLLSKLDLALDADAVLMAEQIIQATVKQTLGYGPATPDAMLLSSVDSLRFPLQRIYSRKDTTPDSFKPNEPEILGKIILAANLGQFYSMIEGYWMQALWNDWYVDSTTRDDSDLILPPKSVRPIVAAISQYRREALSQEAVLHVSNAWRHNLTDAQKERLVSKIPDVRIVGAGAQRSFEALARTKDDHEALMMLLKGLRAERGFYLPLIDEPLNKLGTVTLNMLLRAWEVLYALCARLLETFPAVKDSGVYSVEQLLHYAPTMKKQQLIKLLDSWCNFEEGIAERIVDFLSYGPGNRWELWGHPLIKIDDEELVPLFGPILHGNLERTFELWMQDSGLELSDKGYLFEDYARAELSRSLRQSEILKDAAVHQTKLVLRSDEGYEEIDIIIRLKNTILIGEAKCLLFPSEPIQVFRYFDTLDEARSQVLRKADFARRNLVTLAEQLGIENSDALIIEPFILLNQPFGAGWPQQDVPVVDELIFKRFFEGKWHQIAMYNEANELEALSTFDLYQSQEEAASTVSAYLQNPPQLRHYRQNVKPSIQWYPAIDGNDRPFATINLDVILPLPSLNLTLGNRKQ